MSSYTLWFVVVHTLSVLQTALSQVTSKNISLDTFFDGTKLTLFNPAITGKSGIDSIFSWNNGKVEPISVIRNTDIVERTNPVVFSSAVTSSTAVYSDISSGGNLRVLFWLKMSSGPDLLAWVPDTPGASAVTTPLTANGNQTCTTSSANIEGQMDPFVVVCYNDTLRVDSYLENYNIITPQVTCHDTWNGNAVVPCNTVYPIPGLESLTVCTGGAICPYVNICTMDMAGAISCNEVKNCTDSNTCTVTNMIVNVTLTGKKSMMVCSTGGSCYLKEKFTACDPSAPWNTNCVAVYNCTLPKKPIGDGSCSWTDYGNFIYQNSTQFKLCTGGGGCTTVIICSSTGVCTNTPHCSNGCSFVNNYTNFYGVPPVRLLQELDLKEYEEKEGEEVSISPQSYINSDPPTESITTNRRVLVYTPRLGNTTVNISTPATRTVFYNVYQWKINNVIAEFSSTPDYQLGAQSNDVIVDLMSIGIINNCVASIVPIESNNLNLFLTNNNVVAFYFIWAKPKSNAIIYDTYNNTDIYLMKNTAPTPPATALVLTATRMKLNPINVTTTLRLITDIRTVYETTIGGFGSIGLVKIYLSGLVNVTNDNITKMYECNGDFTNNVIASCTYMTGPVLDTLFPITNLLYQSLNLYQLYFTSRGDPTVVYKSIYDRSSFARAALTLIPHSLYPNHKLSTYHAGQTVRWGDPTPANYTFGWNAYKTINSYYAFPTDTFYNNYRGGFMFVDSGLHRFFKKSQKDVNFFYGPVTTGPPEGLILNYIHANGSNQTTNITIEMVNLTTITDFTGVGFPVQSTKCYKSRICRMRLPNQPLGPRYAPTYSFTGYQGESFNGKLMVLREQIALYYNNDGMINPLPPSIQYFFPGFAVFRTSDSSMSFETVKCNIERAAYIDQYLCSALYLPAVPAFSKDFMTGDKVIIFYDKNGIYFETARSMIAPTAGSYLLTQRFPMMNQYYYNLTSTENSILPGGILFNNSIAVGSFAANDISLTSRVCVVSNQAVAHNVYAAIPVVGCKAVTSQVYKVVLTYTAPDYYLSHISGVTNRGFNFVRESVRMKMAPAPVSYAVGVDTSVTIPFNELNFNPATLNKAAFCSFGNNFAMVAPGWKVIFGKWTSPDSLTGHGLYLSENAALAANYTDVLASKCISDLQYMVLITSSGAQMYLTIYNLTDVSNPKHIIVVQQKLEEVATFGVNMDNAISYGDGLIYARVASRTFVFRHDHFNQIFLSADIVPSLAGINYRIEYSTYNSLKFQTFPINFTSVVENNTIDIINQMTFNLTSKNPLDQQIEINGHVWDLTLVKPPYVGNVNLNMSSRILKMPFLTFKLDTSTLTPFSSSMMYHSRFALDGNTTAVIKNLNAEQTYLEVKPNKIMSLIDGIAFTAFIPHNCHEVALLSATYPAFTAILKCSNTIETYIYGVMGTMSTTFNPTTYKHFTASYGGFRNEPSRMQALIGIVNPSTDFVVNLFNPQNGTLWQHVFKIPVAINANGSAASVAIKSFSFQLSTNSTTCSLAKSMIPNYVTTCGNLSNSIFNIYTLSSAYSLVSTSVTMPPAVLPLTITCLANYTQLIAASATLRCFIGTNIEIYMVDFDENNNYKYVDYSTGGLLATNASNPRIYSVCMDFAPQAITATQHFIGVLGKQTTADLTTTYPTWGFHLFHIDSMNTLNFTNKVNNSNQYAGLILPKAGGNNPFHFASIHPFMENSFAANYTYDNTTNSTVATQIPVHDNYFHLQDGTGNIYTYKADSYILQANTSNLKIKSYMDASVLNVDGVAYPFSQLNNPITVSSVYEKKVALVNNQNNAVSTNNVGNTARNTIWVTVGIAAAAAVAIGLYLMLRKADTVTKSLGREVRNESGILRL